MNVIMFHSIGCDNIDWHRKHLTVPLKVFISFCKFINRKKYLTYFLDDWYDNSDQLKGKEHLILTFDDGYLDNWVYLFPLLKRYKIKATIFINPEFVDPSKLKRPNLDNVWSGNISEYDLQPLGFLNWSEIKKMQESGLVDIQSHSMSHDWVFSSNKIIDIYTGENKYDWLTWLMEPGKKNKYTTENQKNLVPIGYPVFEAGRALGVRKFFPSSELIQHSMKIVGRHKSLSDILNLKNEIIEKINQFGFEQGFGNYESEKEQIERYKYELIESKRILEEKLDKPTDFLCWPGGGYNDLSIKISKEAGYKASTLVSHDKRKNINKNKVYKRIKRFSVGGKLVRANNAHFPLLYNLMWCIYLAKTGSIFHSTIIRALKLIYLIRNRIAYKNYYSY